MTRTRTRNGTLVPVATARWVCINQGAPTGGTGGTFRPEAGATFGDWIGAFGYYF